MKKVMFNDKYGLTKAVLEGRKTMTRRVANFNPVDSPLVSFNVLPYNKVSESVVIQRLWRGSYNTSHHLTPKYKVGEVVAVAQNYNEVFDEFATIVYLQDKPTPDNFKAFGEQSDVTLPKTMPGWNNKMFVKADFMPHQIRITNVRVERLQDISDEDCIREGVQCFYTPGGIKYFGGGQTVPEEYRERIKTGEIEVAGGFNSAREAFAALIDKVSGKGVWKSNPFVFVYEFELVK